MNRIPTWIIPLLFIGFFGNTDIFADEWFEAGGNRILLYKIINEWQDCIENRQAALNLEQDPGESREDFALRKEKALDSFPPCSLFCGKVITYISKGGKIEFLPVTKKARITFYWSDLTVFPGYKSRFSCSCKENLPETEISFEGDGRVHVLLPVNGPGFSAVLKKNAPYMRMEFTGMTGGVTNGGILFCDPKDSGHLKKLAPNAGCDHYFSSAPKKAYKSYGKIARKEVRTPKSDTALRPVCLPASIVIYLNDTDEILAECFQ